MLALLIFTSVLVLVRGGTSPNGANVLDYLTPAQEAAYPADVLQEALMDVPDLITKHGYPVEQYLVQTSDGYILKLHRIPSGKTVIPASSRPKHPVFLKHGLLGSSADFIVLGPTIGLAFILADAGFDVWMGNSRGNYYSRRHATLNPTSDNFWKYSWHEIGYYDLPVSIDFILMKTGKPQLHYVGHSEGTTEFFVMASTRTNYNQKIRSMNAMAPAVYLKNTNNVILKTMDPLLIYIANVFQLFGSGEFIMSPLIKNSLVQLYCNINSPYYLLCNSSFGTDYVHVDPLRVPLYAAQAPAGASTRQFLHYTQIYKSGEFKRYDYGFIENLIKYGRLTPPLYELSNVVAPVALHYALNDADISVIDVNTLYDKLVNPIGKYQVPRETFTHYNYVIGDDANTQVYNTVINIINTYD